MSRFPLIIALVILIAAPMSAQRRDRGDREQQRSEQAARRAEIHAWFTTDVLPLVRQWQRDFDATLTGAELATLKRLRTEAAALRTQIRTDMQHVASSSDRKDRRARRSATREIRDRHRDAMRGILDELEPIARSHKDNLRAIYDAHEEQIDDWRQELRAMLDASGARGRRHDMRSEELKMLDGSGHRMAVRFLLWNGEAPPEPPTHREATNMGRMGESLPPVSVSPNPGAATARVQMDGLPEGPTTIEVFDMNGNLVRSQAVSVASKRLDETIPLDGLAPGTYMVSVNTQSGRRSETLVVTH